MSDFPALLLLGAVAGLIASAVMNGFQALAAGLFGQTGTGDPATVKLADRLGNTLTGRPVSHRACAGQIVHYATGIALGILYVTTAATWPGVTLWFGVAYGLVVAAALDYVVVPGLGLGPPAWKTPIGTHLYGLVSHAIFGAALQAAREIGFLLF